MLPKRPRLDPALYVDLKRYFLTFCTARRRRLFAQADIVQLVLEHILQTAQLFDIEVIAYCFMPDHVHLLVEGCTESADARVFVHQAKQRAADAFTRKWAGTFWEPSYYDRVLRDDEATLAVARYILENPLRAGLVDSPTKHPFIGSIRHKVEDVLDAVCWQP
jgi:putative transposase